MQPLSRRSLAFTVPLGMLLTGTDALGQSTRDVDPGQGVFFATGFRVGEVMQESAIIWTRLTAQAERNWNGIVPPLPDSPTRVMVENLDVAADAYEGAVPG